MKKLLCVALLAGSALSSSAFGISVSAQPLEGGGYIDRTATVYSSLTGGYAAFAAATGPIGFDDYQTSNLADNVTTLAQFKFVGGVSTVGGILTMQFFDNSGPTPTLFSSFNVALPQAGNFIWTITLGALPDGSDSTFVIPTNGVTQMIADSATTGRFYLTSAATPAAVGFNSPTFGSGAALDRNQAFELVSVPTPSALALLGLGGLVATRRRR